MKISAHKTFRDSFSYRFSHRTFLQKLIWHHFSNFIEIVFGRVKNAPKQETINNLTLFRSPSPYWPPKLQSLELRENEKFCNANPENFSVVDFRSSNLELRGLALTSRWMFLLSSRRNRSMIYLTFSHAWRSRGNVKARAAEKSSHSDDGNRANAKSSYQTWQPAA